MNESRLTIKQAAKALGTSARTIRRRIAEGALPAQKIAKGKLDVWTIDPADLASYAQSVGQTMARPSGNHDQRVTPAEVSPEAVNGQSPAKTSATAAEVDSLRQQVRQLEGERDFLRRVLENVTKALPPAGRAEPSRPSWWRRLFGR